jgi:hypothetical protein
MIMKYDKLKDLLRNKKYSIAKAAISINRTEAWFHRAIKNETMTISDLEKLLKLCNTNLFEFFGGQPDNQLNEPHANYEKIDNEVIELLRENRQLRVKIETLEKKKP